MGKKGSWFSAIKRVFIPHSKEKLADEPQKNSTKEKKKKKGLGKLRHGDSSSFIPFFRKPSTIEDILDEAEREHNLIFRPPTPPPEQPQTPPFVPQRVPSPRVPSPRVSSQRVASPPKAASPRVASPKIASPRAASPRIVQYRSEITHRPEPTLRSRHASATKIQAAYRGYTARRSFKALKGLVRLQGVVRGQNVKRQTSNAMKYMQLLVRVQSQIQLRRIHMLENQVRHQSQYRNDKEGESTLSKWNMSQASEVGNEDWDDSVLTKEEIEARLQRKVEAVVKRERAMAYAYSHKLWKANPNSNMKPMTDIRSGGFPWWWNWLERQLPLANPPESLAIKNFQLTPPRPHSELKATPPPASSTNKNQHFGLENTDATPTPRSTKSTIFPATRQARTPPSYRILHNSQSLLKYSRARGSGADSPFNNIPMKDDDSLASCPPFSVVPSYMAPTASAKAKVKASPSSASSESKRRVSFPLTQGVGSFKWNKFSSKDSSGSPRILDKNPSLQSIGNLSIDSTVSMPAGVGRKPFNRFV